jgi:hypothetical protein
MITSVRLPWKDTVMEIIFGNFSPCFYFTIISSHQLESAKFSDNTDVLFEPMKCDLLVQNHNLVVVLEPRQSTKK